MSMQNRHQSDLMVFAAWLYYEDGLTHEEIGRRLSLSRVTVTRLLQRARREGVVQIRITRPLPIHYELERQLQQRFNLAHVVVVRSQPSIEDTLHDIGWAGAHYLRSRLRNGLRLGIAWSRTVSQMARYLEPPERPVRCVVNELAGSYPGSDHPYSISGAVARVLNATLEPLPVPVIVQNEATRQALLKEPQVGTALQNAQQCDLAFVGLGEVSPMNTMVQTGYMTPEELTNLEERGAAGEILGRFYDLRGEHVPSPVESRMISLNWEAIRSLPHVVAMVSGSAKVPAIRGAIAAGVIKALITDVATAQAVLDWEPVARV